MSNKTPFELRFDMLSMAKEYMDKQIELNTDFAVKAFTEALKAGKATADQIQEFAPKSYSISDLIDKATELSSFVSGTGKK